MGRWKSVGLAVFEFLVYYFRIWRIKRKKPDTLPQGGQLSGGGTARAVRKSLIYDTFISYGSILLRNFKKVKGVWIKIGAFGLFGGRLPRSRCSLQKKELAPRQQKYPRQPHNDGCRGLFFRRPMGQKCGGGLFPLSTIIYTKPPAALCAAFLPAPVHGGPHRFLRAGEGCGG